MSKAVVPLVQESQERSLGQSRCFVMMPSGRNEEYGQGEVEADFVFDNIIEPAVNNVLGKGSADRESDSLEPGAITPKIIQKLNDYDFAIVDITGGNPNVFFELGVRHSLRRKTTIILRQKTTDIPFDIGNYRVLDYTPFKFDEARNSLEEIIRHSISDKFKNDSLVVDVLGDYDIIFKAKMSVEKMPWEYYFKTIERVSLILKTAHEEKNLEKKYSPDAIIGISNGGMIFADYLHRSRIYSPGDCQFHSLWANRDRPGKYFEYKSNELLLEGILKDTNKQPADVRILMVDDNVGSGDTSKLAMEFIKKHSAVVHVRFLPLFFNREDILPRIYKHLIWSHRVFLWEHPEIENLHFVNYRYFPYPKSISG